MKFWYDFMPLLANRFVKYYSQISGFVTYEGTILSSFNDPTTCGDILLEYPTRGSLIEKTKVLK